MDELSLVLTEEPVADDTTVSWDETGGTVDDLPEVGDENPPVDDDLIWDGGEAEEGSTGEDDGYIDEELIGDDSSEEDWLIDDETWVGDGEDWLVDDEIILGIDWGCGTIDVDLDILITDDLIKIYNPDDGPKTLDETPVDDTGTETATLDDPAICMIFVCDTII